MQVSPKWELLKTILGLVLYMVANGDDYIEMVIISVGGILCKENC